MLPFCVLCVYADGLGELDLLGDLSGLQVRMEPRHNHYIIELNTLVIPVDWRGAMEEG